MRKPVLLVTISSMPWKLDSSRISSCAARKTVLTSHQKNCSRPPTGLMRCLSLRPSGRQTRRCIFHSRGFLRQSNRHTLSWV